jgi:hypothetical protein
MIDLTPPDVTRKMAALRRRNLTISAVFVVVGALMVAVGLIVVLTDLSISGILLALPGLFVALFAANDIRLQMRRKQ